MARRSVWLAALAVAGVAAVLRSRRGRERERVEVGYSDGATVALENGAPAASALLAVARSALRAAHAGR